jgi:hypothetical protein
VKAGKGPSDTWRAFAKVAPLSSAALADLETLLFKAPDPLPGLSTADKRARLARISYAKYLTDLLKLSPDVVRVLQALPHSLYGIGIDGVPAQDAWGLGLPGFAAMHLDPGPGVGQNRDSIRSEEADKYFFHFPDGNSSIARLMVRRLIPGAVPGRTAADIVTAHTDYSRLDQPGNGARIRLNSTAVRVKHVGDPASATEVEVTYLRDGKLRSARARSCVLACWHTTLPYLCPELGAEQKEALAYAVKVPIVYTSVLLRNWTAFTKAGYSGFYAPAGYHSSLDLTIPLHLGEFASPKDPKESVTVHMTRTPCSPGLPARDQHRAGRADLLATSFERFEKEIRDQFARAYGPSGLDADRDILAITVNRWPHGYAYQYNSLFDPFWLEGGTTPCEIARRPFGRWRSPTRTRWPTPTPTPLSTARVARWTRCARFAVGLLRKKLRARLGTVLGSAATFGAAVPDRRPCFFPPALTGNPVRVRPNEPSSSAPRRELRRFPLVVASRCLSLPCSTRRRPGPGSPARRDRSARHRRCVPVIPLRGRRHHERRARRHGFPAGGDQRPSRGGTLRFPARVYRIRADVGLNLKSGITLDLGKATLVAANVTNARCRIFTIDGDRGSPSPAAPWWAAAPAPPSGEWASWRATRRIS